MTEHDIEIKIFENTPYREDKNLIQAYNSFMELLPNDGWALFRDADTLFLDSYYGEIITRAIRNNPNAGCFTCVTNRIGNPIQLHNEYSGDDISRHRSIAERLKKEKYNSYKPFEFNISKRSTLSGMMFVLSKDAWKRIGGFKKSTIKGHEAFNRNMLGIDNQLHKDLYRYKIKVVLIEELYIYHWYRGGTKNVDHLKANTTYTPKNDTRKDSKEKGVTYNAEKFIKRRKR